MDKGSTPSPPPILNRKPLVNNQIRAAEVRLIDENDKQLGIVPLEEAFRITQEKELDIVQVTEKVVPPVCKICDYGKYLYREEKKGRKGKKQKTGQLKGIRLSFNISSHDLETKARQTAKFLGQGNKVRVELKMRGREKALESFARQKIEKFLEIVGQSTPYKMERPLKKEPRGLAMIISKQ